MKHFHIDTPLGTMVAISDEAALYLLEFVDRKNLKRQLRHFSMPLVEGDTSLTPFIKEALAQYFRGKPFSLPFSLSPFGTPFQQRVWAVLQEIPYGQTRSYAEIARAIQQPRAMRAVAQAIGANPLALVVPCHRVICTDHTLGGYSGGITRKQRLLQHEKTDNACVVSDCSIKIARKKLPLRECNGLGGAYEQH